ncbi:MAG: secretin and TonB N-terminal domain-containing protein, partial [Desulfobulbus sp.]|nr:secretin and TonB N-terminal domain-containing protein [Desulfobulbus sp.]
MLHPFSNSVSVTPQLSLRIFFILVSCLIAPQVSHAEDGINQIVSMQSKVNGNQTEIRLKGVKPFVSSIYELPKPERVVVDVADADLAANFVLPKDTSFRIATTKVPGTNPLITRFEFFVPNLGSFSSRQEGADTLLVIESKGTPSTALNAEPDSSGNKQIEFTGIDIKKSKKQTVVRIGFNHKIVHYKKETTAKDSGNNPQLIIDIDQVSASDQFLTTKKVNTTLSKIITAQRGSGIRVTLVSASDVIFPYTISEKDDGLEIFVEEGGVKDQVSKIIGQRQNIESQLPDINPLEAKLSPQAREQQMQDAFNFSGYNKDRISVEFQKMDLHNVFNFLRQVSGVNIVVDESVQGSLTLVLDDVPWDFALDIILNLKGLEKEERFNTLVIYAKGKGFKWPEQVANNLSFEADSAVIEKEALVVQQQEKQSDEVVEAKTLIAKGMKAEKQENFENAALIYEHALDKWPDNTRLANKISALYLVRLQQNAKGMYFAQRALTIDPKNQVALLHAGIASANMQDLSQ